ncbi:vacuolar protein sorting-associated protein 45 [Nematocida major]|uniref:vacuolar protein sorting-associated protein 45 n=1 Tax=Nematocida major TaxID=1912982 RepID=UPI002007C330|nr:vacuolar protein sorting-associated protein 45 [Nematocida major]KAH9385175.1 vacuolar protein sorting-associated protein 45 [Nematocida major]
MKHSVKINLVCLFVMNTLLEDIRSALGRGDGIKALLLDEFTRDSISPIISHAELLSYDFFLFETISSTRQPIDVSCVAILSKSSLPSLVREVEQQTYKEYFVFITDELSDADIEMIAKKDTNGAIKELQELYFSGTPMDTRFVILNGKTSQEMAHSLSCLLKGLEIVPGIRYQFGSEVCYKTAESVESRFAPTAPPNADLVIVDRAVDLLTPIQYPWTYQSMAAEYLEYKAGVISWGSNSLCISKEDMFFEECKFRDIVYAAEALKKTLKEVRASREVIGEFVANVRERAKESSRLTMHLNAIGEISSACLENDAVSEAMADLIEGAQADLLESVRDANEQQKLRLALVEYICEHVLPQKTVFNAFWKNKAPKWTLYEGYKKEVAAFAQKYVKNILGIRRPSYQKNINRKLGYIPEVVKIASELKSGKLSDKNYPTIKKGTHDKRLVIIFIAGGATFIEYRALMLLFSEQYKKDEILLVSTHILTGRQILSDISGPYGACNNP